MSCRQNDGNSAATSLAKFLTNSEEHLVSHLFHVARRESALALKGEAKHPASKEEVLAFLSRAHSLARHDSRVPDARRASLIERIEGAEKDIANGILPTKATFAAWSSLRQRLEDENTSNQVNAEPVDPSIGFTPEGITIAREEVNLALMDLQRLQNLLAKKQPASIPAGAVSTRTHESLTMTSAQVDLAREKYNRLLVAYDATDTGYNNLLENIALAESEDNEDAVNELTHRLRESEQQRSEVSLLVSTLAEAEELGNAEAKRLFQISREEAKEAEGIYRAEPTNAEKRAAYDELSARARKASRVYLYTLLDDSTIKLALAYKDARSPQLWNSLKGNALASQNEIWAAVDLYLSDRDVVEVRLGRLRDGEITTKSFARAEARQSLLDAEGKGIIDNINRRHFESITRKRGVPGKSIIRPRQ